MKKKAILLLSLFLCFAVIMPVYATDQITITKEWDDDLSGESASNREAPTVTIQSMTTKEELYDFIYPVGSYYETSSAAIDPNTAFTGTWVLETEGQVHVSGGSSYPVSNADANDGAGATDGGTTVGSIPSHTHSVPAVSGTLASAGAHTHAMGLIKQIASGSGDSFAVSGTGHITSSSAGNHAHTVSINAGTTGSTGDASVTNMMPYVNVYRWHRVE